MYQRKRDGEVPRLPSDQVFAVGLHVIGLQP